MYSNRRQAASLKHGSEQAVFTSRNPQSRFLHIGKPRPKKQPPILEPRLGIAAVSQFKDNELKRMLHNKNMLQSCSSRERETYIYMADSKQARERERKRERERCSHNAASPKPLAKQSKDAAGPGVGVLLISGRPGHGLLLQDIAQLGFYS